MFAVKCKEANKTNSLVRFWEIYDAPICFRNKLTFNSHKHFLLSFASQDHCVSDYSSPKTMVLFMKNSNGLRFFLWNEPDELVALKWCPIISPMLLLSYLMWKLSKKLSLKLSPKLSRTFSKKLEFSSGTNRMNLWH